MRRPLRFTFGVGVGAVGIAALLTALIAMPPRVSGPAGPPPAGSTSTVPVPQTSGQAAPISASTGSARPRSAFTPGSYDVEAQIKEAAAQFVERAGTWGPSDPRDPAARLGSAGYPTDLVETAEPLLDAAAEEATATLLYPQYGGLTDRKASVMVLARQELRTDGDARVREVLLDVRMQRAADGTWQVTSTVDPARPPTAPPRSGGPTQLGRAVLDNPAIRIPEPARTDIIERRVGDPILSVLTRLAGSYTLDLQVLVSGHPGTVFPTSRVSNHSVGRAVDVRAVDGRPISDIPRDDRLLAEFMIAAGRAGATEVGGPIVPDGRGYFSDDVHQDHFHLGITPTKPPAAPS